MSILLNLIAVALATLMMAVPVMGRSQDDPREEELRTQTGRRSDQHRRNMQIVQDAARVHKSHLRHTNRARN